MAYRHLRGLALLLSAVPAAATLLGCLDTNKPLHYLGEAPLQYYQDKATEIDFPLVDEPTPPEVATTLKPHTLLDRRRDEVWDMTIVEALHTAMANSTIIRTATPLSPSNRQLENPETVPTVFDPAIQATGVLFGSRGVEAALSAFDAQFTTSMLWGRDEQVQNNIFFAGGLAPGSTLTQETGNFNAALSKQFAHGGGFTVAHNMNYLGTQPLPGQLFPSIYRGNLQAQYRQPLLAGAGTEFTRIAGPIGQAFGGLTGVTQGVAIARINQDISIADFESHVRNMLFDVERLYWDLYLSYRVYDAAIAARNSALRTWREAKARLEVGGVANFKPADEAQARDRYFETRAAAEAALARVYTGELNLRRIMGLPVNDGRILRPVDEPTTAEFTPDWYVSLAEALTLRVELRRQKWSIKSLELQLAAAKSLTKPRLDFVSGYQVNSFGDRLFGERDDDAAGTPQGLRSAYETLTQGNQTGWNLGFEFSMPLGFRSAHAQVQNIELRLARAKEVLAAQELDISHELAAAMQDLAAQYKTAQSNFNRRRAAQRSVELFDAEVRAGTATLDVLLRAQASLADAETAYFTSLTEYNRSIALFNLRKGTLLQQYNVQLEEGPWMPEAYDLALRRALARSHAFDVSPHWMHTEPEEYAAGSPVDGVELALPPGELEVPPDPIEDPIEDPLPPTANDEARATGAEETTTETSAASAASPADAPATVPKVARTLRVPSAGSPKAAESPRVPSAGSPKAAESLRVPSAGSPKAAESPRVPSASLKAPPAPAVLDVPPAPEDELPSQSEASEAPSPVPQRKLPVQGPSLAAPPLPSAVKAPLVPAAEPSEADDTGT